MFVCYFCDVELEENMRDVTSCCGKYVHPLCASQFCGKQCKCCSIPWPKEGIMILKSFMEWCEEKNCTGGRQSCVRRTIPAIDNDDGLYYKWIAIDEDGNKIYLHNHEDLSSGYTSDFCLAPVMRFFSDFVASPARQGSYTCDKFWRQIEGRANRIL